MDSVCAHETLPVDTNFIDQAIEAAKAGPGVLLSVLERVQEHHPRKYLSRDTLKYVAARMNLPLSQIASVVSFYAFFNLEPQGRHTVCVCRGTACHVRGSQGLLDGIRSHLGIEEGRRLPATTDDGEITLRTVACFGQCALAPILEVDHEAFGHMDEDKANRQVAALKARNTETVE